MIPGLAAQALYIGQGGIGTQQRVVQDIAQPDVADREADSARRREGLGGGGGTGSFAPLSHRYGGSGKLAGQLSGKGVQVYAHDDLNPAVVRYSMVLTREDSAGNMARNTEAGKAARPRIGVIDFRATRAARTDHEGPTGVG